MIAAGRVKLNGEIVHTPALDITAGDRVLVDDAPLPTREPPRLWRYHKPKGRVTTHKDPEGRPTVFEGLPDDLPRLISVGRLDFNTEGLLLLTNDGELARHLELPATGWARRYRVRAHGSAAQDALDGLKDGITIDGVSYGPIEAAFERQQGGNVWLSVMIREGKNREIRRIMEHLGLSVNRLIRVSYGPFMLGDLEPGEIEEVRPRVLMDQLGPVMTAELGIERASRRPTGQDRREPVRRKAAGGARAYLTRKRTPEPESRREPARRGERGKRDGDAPYREGARGGRFQRDDREQPPRTRLRRVLPLDPAGGEAVRFEEMPVRPARRSFRERSEGLRDARGRDEEQRQGRRPSAARGRDGEHTGLSRRREGSAPDFDRPRGRPRPRPDDGEARRDDGAARRRRDNDGDGGRPGLNRTRDADRRAAPARDRDRGGTADRAERPAFRRRDREDARPGSPKSDRAWDDARGDSRGSGGANRQRAFQTRPDRSEPAGRSGSSRSSEGARLRPRDRDGAEQAEGNRPARTRDRDGARLRPRDRTGGEQDGANRDNQIGRDQGPRQKRSRADNTERNPRGASASSPRPGGRKTSGGKFGPSPGRAGKAPASSGERGRKSPRPGGRPKPSRDA